MSETVVKILNILVGFLSQILKANAESLGGIFRGISLKKFFLELVPIFFIEPNNVVEHIVPRESVVSEREKKFVAHSLSWVGEQVPLSDVRGLIQALHELLRRNRIFALSSVKQRNVCCASYSVVRNEGLLNLCCHDERSVVRRNFSL